MSVGLDPVVGKPSASTPLHDFAGNWHDGNHPPSDANLTFQARQPWRTRARPALDIRRYNRGLRRPEHDRSAKYRFGPQTTLGYLPNSNQTGGTLSLTNGGQSANIALLGNYMASSFAVVGDSHGGTMVTAERPSGTQSLLTNPQHT